MKLVNYGTAVTAEALSQTPSSTAWRTYEGLLCCELTLQNKPNRTDHDKYAAMGLEAFYAEALTRMNKIIDRTL